MLSYAGRNRYSVNFLRTIYFDNPEWTLCRVGLMPATWMKHREAMEELVLAHPRIFPGYVRGERDYDALPSPLYAGGLHTDCWGIVWQNIEPGSGQYSGGPSPGRLGRAGRLRPPNPLTDAQFGTRDWEAVAQGSGHPEHGVTWRWAACPTAFFTCCSTTSRGFENFMLDLAAEEARLGRVIEMLDDYNLGVTRRFLELGAEMLSYGEDLGMQSGLPISPAMWRRYIKPSYTRLFSLGVEAGLPVRMHTDGYILDIIPDLIECGVTLLNPQIRPNGIDGLRRTARGKVAIDQDLDRQLFPFATPSQIEDHIGEVYEGLYEIHPVV